MLRIAVREGAENPNRGQFRGSFAVAGDAPRKVHADIPEHRDKGVEILARRPDVDPANIHVIALGRAAVPALYATAFDTRIQTADLEGLLKSYQSILETKIHRQVFEQVVPGAIRHYDLPDLVKALGPRRVAVRSTVDALGQ